MFSIEFLFTSMYQKINGGSMRSMLLYTAGANLAGVVILLGLNGFRFEFTPFSLLMACCASIVTLGFSYCSINALGKIDLSLFSVLSMLGGMTLPFIAGLMFFRETLTPGKIICFLTVAVSLLFTVEKGKGHGGLGYYIGIFILNGMSGIVAKFFQASPFEKTSDAGYSVLTAAVSSLLCVLLLLFMKKPKLVINLKTCGLSAAHGILSCVANYLLLVALNHIPASAQYPFVTGGVMIVSTVICFFTDKKPSKREIVSVFISFVGVLALVLFD